MAWNGWVGERGHVGTAHGRAEGANDHGQGAYSRRGCSTLGAIGPRQGTWGKAGGQGAGAAGEGARGQDSLDLMQCAGQARTDTDSQDSGLAAGPTSSTSHPEPSAACAFLRGALHSGHGPGGIQHTAVVDAPNVHVVLPP